MASIPDLVPWFGFELELRESTIHGTGLFTRCHIEAGAIVFRFGGMLRSKDERFSGLLLSSTSVPVTESVVIAETSDSQRDPTDFINHSCDPNLGLFDALTTFALRNIEPWEELTIDYGFWEVDENWKLKQDCRCGSNVCRHTVSGNDWRKMTPDQPSFGFFSPFLRRRILESASKADKASTQRS